jgi:hypothetical protein
VVNRLEEAWELSHEIVPVRSDTSNCGPCTPRPKARSESSGFVSDGFERAVDGIELEVRTEVEAKYAVEWKASRLFKRWLLRQRMKREITARIIERSAHISDKALF